MRKPCACNTTHGQTARYVNSPNTGGDARLLCNRSHVMTFKVTLVGAHAHEHTPAIALYAIEPNGRVGKKIATVAEGQLTVQRDQKGAVAFGPDVEDAASLDAKGFVTLRLADHLPTWEENKEIQIPAQWWRGWLWFTTCVSGTVSRCYPFLLKQTALRAIALGQRQIIFPKR